MRRLLQVSSWFLRVFSAVFLSGLLVSSRWRTKRSAPKCGGFSRRHRTDLLVRRGEIELRLGVPRGFFQLSIGFGGSVFHPSHLVQKGFSYELVKDGWASVFISVRCNLAGDQFGQRSSGFFFFQASLSLYSFPWQNSENALDL